jgi:hypothetical protein
MARASVSLLAVMGHPIRRFESFPSPPNLMQYGKAVSS